jgi:DNA-binding CsgD family transcriptional regulator
MSSAAERARAPIYTDLFRPRGADYMAAAIFKASDELWSFNVLRSEPREDADAQDRDLLALAQPYLARMLEVSRALATAATEGALNALENSGAAAVLLGGGGRVLHLTARAAGLLGDGLAIRGGRLAAESAVAEAELQARIASALSGDGASLGAEAGPLQLPGADGGLLLADVTPLRGLFAEAFGRSAALVLLWDPSARRRPHAQVLRQLYGLTPREAEVAGLLAAGERIEDIAEALGLRASSARQIVKVLLWKTGTSRQSELVASLAALPSAD